MREKEASRARASSDVIVGRVVLRSWSVIEDGRIGVWQDAGWRRSVGCGVQGGGQRKEQVAGVGIESWQKASSGVSDSVQGELESFGVVEGYWREFLGRSKCESG